MKLCAEGVTIRIEGKDIRFDVEASIARGLAGGTINFKDIDETSELEEMTAFLGFLKICLYAFVALGRKQGGHRSQDHNIRAKEKNLCKLAALLR